MKLRFASAERGVRFHAGSLCKKHVPTSWSPRVSSSNISLSLDIVLAKSLTQWQAALFTPTCSEQPERETGKLRKTQEGSGTLREKQTISCQA
jgi:hypothetical protein